MEQEEHDSTPLDAAERKRRKMFSPRLECLLSPLRDIETDREEPDSSLCLEFQKVSGDRDHCDLFGSFADALDVQKSGLFLLAHAWNCSKYGVLFMHEFIRGMKVLGARNIGELRQLVCTELQSLTCNQDYLKEVYLSSFEYLVSRDARRMYADLEPAMDCLKCLLEGAPFTPSFCVFLKITNRAIITRDQWKSFFAFCQHVHEDLSNHDPYDAWPTLLDDFVAWRHRLDGGVLSETGEDVEPAASLYAPLRPHFTLDHLCKSLSAPVEVMEWDQYWDVDPRAKRQGRHSPQPTCFDMEWDE